MVERVGIGQGTAHPKPIISSGIKTGWRLVGINTGLIGCDRRLGPIFNETKREPFFIIIVTIITVPEDSEAYQTAALSS